jgi:hypothetical protein
MMGREIVESRQTAKQIGTVMPSVRILAGARRARAVAAADAHVPAAAAASHGLPEHPPRT